MITLGFVSLALSIACYSISQLQQHGKLRWQKGVYGFWDEKSHYRKYKKDWSKDPLGYDRFPPPDNWYYRFFKIKYKERFPLSATFLVTFTDGYHLMQFLFLLFLSSSITLFIGFDWWLLLCVWSGIHIIHFLVYKLLSRQ